MCASGFAYKPISTDSDRRDLTIFITLAHIVSSKGSGKSKPIDLDIDMKLFVLFLIIFMKKYVVEIWFKLNKDLIVCCVHKCMLEEYVMDPVTYEEKPLGLGIYKNILCGKVQKNPDVSASINSTFGLRGLNLKFPTFSPYITMSTSRESTLFPSFFSLT